MKRIKWEMTGNDPNDIKAIVPEGMLRVERMDKFNYWWCVYFNDQDYHSYENPGRSLQSAKRKCVYQYKKLQPKQ